MIAATSHVLACHAEAIYLRLLTEQQKADPTNAELKRKIYGRHYRADQARYKRLGELAERARTLHVRYGTEARRQAKIEYQEALGGISWEQIRSTMIERGFTHINTMSGPQPLATWPGPYGNGIPAYYRGMLLANPSQWQDMPESAEQVSTFFQLGVWSCVTLPVKSE